ncbi:hypothetical protein BJV78DRAFT_726811 [Lactifluus subvellereus]|nr:hypothetical protein BJV78DRAFT_726811 [Lactifluus subvellereus]
MVYYAQHSAQFAAWKQLADLRNTEAFTTETLSLALNLLYRRQAFRVWGEYVKRHGNIEEKLATELVQVVVDGWVTLQVAYRFNQGVTSVDSQLSRSKGYKEGCLGYLESNMEFRCCKRVTPLRQVHQLHCHVKLSTPSLGKVSWGQLEESRRTPRQHLYALEVVFRVAFRSGLGCSRPICVA